MFSQRSGWTAHRLGHLALMLLLLAAAAGLTVAQAAAQSPGGVSPARAGDAALRGRIVNSDGAPLAGAVVQALRHVVDQGRRVLSVVAETNSDTTGGFRLQGLRPGRYFVRAFVGGGDAQPPEAGERPAPTYYPGVTAPEAASEVRADSALESELVPFRLRQDASATLRGRVVAHDRRPLLSAVVVMSPGMAVQGETGEIGAARIEPDGAFTFSRVPPGGYFIRARGKTGPDGTSLYATFRVVVDGRDVSGVELVLAPGGAIAGLLSVQPQHGSPPPALESLRVRAPLADGSPFGDPLAGAVGANGRFHLTNVVPGSHVITVEGLNHPWRIADARLQGRDVLTAPFDVERDRPLEGLHILLSDTAAGVKGTVSLSQAGGQEHVLVVAFPADALHRRVPLRFVRAVQPAPDGSYRILGLPPGEYLVAAVVEMTVTDALDADALDRLAPLAARVELQEARVASLPLDVVRFPDDFLP